VTLLLLPTAAEWYARQFLDSKWAQGIRFTIPGPLNCMVRSALLGVEFAPNCSGMTPSLPGIQTNELGLRDDPLLDDGARRILSIGDSCTVGWGMPQQLAYPQQLQQILDSSYGVRRFRVINAGVPGYTVLQGVRYLRERGLALKPEIVVIAFGFNDASDGGLVQDELFWTPRLLPLLRLNDWLVYHSAFWRWAWLRRVESSEPKRARVPLEDYRRVLGETADLATGAGARALVLVFLAKGPGVGAYGEAAEAVARERGLPFLRYEGPRIDMVHPTARGYSALARALLDELVAAGDLPSRG
jgi:lysophospholipase L1-like esterase